MVRELTGLPLEPMFSASKLRHLLDSDPALRIAAESGSVCAGTIDSWLIWNLTGGSLHVTDAGNASRTLLFDIHNLHWDAKLLELFEIPAPVLPSVCASYGVVGETVHQRALPALPIAAVLADSHAALYGLGCSRSTIAKATYGTGTSVMALTGNDPADSASGLGATVAWMGDRPTYALEGNVYSSGATVDWVARVLGVSGAQAVERLAGTVPDSGGVHLVPAFAGLGAPYWQPHVRGTINGLSFASGREELARAAIDSIAFQVADLVAALEQDLGQPLEELRVDGGASGNDRLMQFQADLLGCTVCCSDALDAAAMGSAFLGGLAFGLFQSEDALIRPMSRRFEPQICNEQRQELMTGWHRSVAQAAGGEAESSRWPA